MKKLKTIIASLLICLQVVPAWAYNTRYVRTPALGASQDGGTGYDATYNPTGQCNGTTDVPYDGSGTNENCAWNNPMWAIGWPGNAYPAKIAGGDTLIINGDAHIGFNADGNSFTGTSSSFPWDAHMNPIPSGPDPAHKTKIYGVNYATVAGKSDTTKLIGIERVEMVLNLEGSSNVDIRSLTITDGLDCGELHANPSVACERNTYPYGEWAKNGISAVDSDNVYLNYVYVDGLASRGVLAGRLQDWVWEMGSISGNPYAGWDGDRGDPDNWANGGTMTFRGTVTEKFKIWWNGCVDTEPETQNPVAASCFTQGQSAGYGDGKAISDKTGALGGANYIYDNVDFSKNTSDGLDDLYKKTGKTVTITKSTFAHNTGNAIKIAGSAIISDTIASGDCDWFNGKSYTYTGGGGFTHCRASGNTIAWDVQGAGNTLDMDGMTITGKGDVLIQTSGTACTGSEHVKMKNSIAQGDTQYGTAELTDDFYNSGATGNGDGVCGSITFDASSSGSGNIIYGTSTNTTGAGIVNSDPQLTDKYADWSIAVGSPARGIRNNALGSTVDYNGFARTTAAGALEYGSTASSPACANTCSLCGSQGTCQASAATCYWWSTSTCNATAEGPICANTCSQCANSSTCGASAATCYWWTDLTCHSTPQTTTAGPSDFVIIGKCTFKGKATAR